VLGIYFNKKGYFAYLGDKAVTRDEVQKKLQRRFPERVAARLLECLPDARSQTPLMTPAAHRKAVARAKTLETELIQVIRGDYFLNVWAGYFGLLRESPLTQHLRVVEAELVSQSPRRGRKGDAFLHRIAKHVGEVLEAEGYPLALTDNRRARGRKGKPRRQLKWSDGMSDFAFAVDCIFQYLGAFVSTPRPYLRKARASIEAEKEFRARAYGL